MTFWEQFLEQFTAQRKRAMTGAQRARMLRSSGPRRRRMDRRYGKAVNREREKARRRRQAEKGMLDFSASERARRARAERLARAD